MPICRIDSLQVIGIHKAGNIKKSVNYGTFIGIIIDELEKIYKDKKSIYNSGKYWDNENNTKKQRIIVLNI